MDANSQQTAVAEQVTDLDAAAALARARQDRRTADAAEADLLRVAAHWADLHPATTGALDGMPVGAGPDGREQLIPLAGDVTPSVAEFACAELAAALRVSTDSGRNLVGDALELRHRLPQTWARILAGDLPAWRGRKIAQTTRWLTREAAAAVDAQVAPYAHRLSLGRVDKLIAAAAAELMPAEAAQRAREAADRRHVTLSDDTSLAGTAHLEIEADAADALAFDQTIAAIARQLGVCGDTDTLDVRRAKAVGQIAHPQAALDLLAADPDTVTTAARTPSTPLVLYLHLSQAAVTGAAPTGDVVSTSAPTRPDTPTPPDTPTGPGAGPVLGRRETRHTGGDLPMLAEQIRAWCGRDDVKLTVTPVIDLAGKISVDGYEIPHRLAEHTTVRDHTCVFPWCEKPARRCDHDHVVEYDFGTDGTGPPPGQTSTDNTACLCRRHHRIKTHSRWTYTMVETGTYLWTSPHGLTFVRDHTGTVPVDRSADPAADTAHPPDREQPRP